MDPWGSFILHHLSGGGGGCPPLPLALCTSFHPPGWLILGISCLSDCAQSSHTLAFSLLFLSERSACTLDTLLVFISVWTSFMELWEGIPCYLLSPHIPSSFRVFILDKCLPGVSSWIRCKRKDLHRNFNSLPSQESVYIRRFVTRKHHGTAVWIVVLMQYFVFLVPAASLVCEMFSMELQFPPFSCIDSLNVTAVLIGCQQLPYKGIGLQQRQEVG